jgi:hypothetical protein
VNGINSGSSPLVQCGIRRVEQSGPFIAALEKHFLQLY